LLTLIFQVMSILLHLYFHIKTHLYKKSLLKSEQKLTSHVSQYKQDSLSAIETRVISDKATNAINALIIGSIVSVSTVVNNLDPSKIVEYPNYLFFYFYQFVFPFITIGTITLLYYLRHAPLRKTILREIVYEYSLRTNNTRFPQ
jgi:hypothetical protein